MDNGGRQDITHYTSTQNKKKKKKSNHTDGSPKHPNDENANLWTAFEDNKIRII